jgi:hypothetical protein
MGCLRHDPAAVLVANGTSVKLFSVSFSPADCSVSRFRVIDELAHHRRHATRRWMRTLGCKVDIERLLTDGQKVVAKRPVKLHVRP